MAAIRKPHGSEKLLWGTVLTVAAGLFAVVWTWPVSSVHLLPSQDLGFFDSAKEPKVGMDVGMVLQPSNGRTVLLIAAGRCTSCSLSHVDFGKLPIGRFGRVVFLVTSGAAETHLPPTLPKALEIRLDKGGLLHKSLSAAILPRLHELSPSGRLVAYQRPDQAPEDFARGRGHG